MTSVPGTRLVDRFGELVWSTARAWGLNPEQGADAVQVTWLRLAEQLDRLQDHYERLGVWLAATARRESLRLLGAGRGDPARTRAGVGPTGRDRAADRPGTDCCGGWSTSCPSAAGGCCGSS